MTTLSNKASSSRKILIITRNLPPLVGGMERLNWHMADELSKYTEVKVIGPRGSKKLKPKNIKLSEAPLKPLPLFMFVAFIKSIWFALIDRPDVILAGSGLTAPLAWFTSKLCGAQSIAYLHGFDITVPKKSYQIFWIPFFKKLDHIIVNSRPTKVLASNAGIREEIISIVYPGVELPTAFQPLEKVQAFRQTYNLKNKKILLSVGRLTTRKGLKEFVKYSLPEIVKHEPNTILVVVGESPRNSLAAGMQTQEEILKVARNHKIESHIVFLGVITDKEQLAIVYEVSDIHVFPVRHIPDDPEGFGMVAIEAAAHGLPTVGFATGGVVDAVKDGVSGYLVERNNYIKLSKQIILLLESPLSKDNIQNKDDIQNFAKQFEWFNFGRSLHYVVENL
ncbi:glycosyltransferase family 4 protein [Alkanindiges sp. WGS2144]|uniref:glycosyltransferase family 4 protein n=1 Tax=Alkanindiges sp. WGS2144 TaxID=3366808 RepID=UPI003752F446